MIDLYDKLYSLVTKNLDEVINIRRHLHSHPELSFKEYDTSKLVSSTLEKLGFDVITNVAKTGVIGILKGKSDSPVLALRADMDALPINEETDLYYKSINEGVMHACGHDIHTANLLGVAMILSELKEYINGTVKLIFQPAEEIGGGAHKMIKEGVLENPKVDSIIGLHVSALPYGTIQYKYGFMTANTSSFSIKIYGKKAHTALPHKGVDAINIAGHIITSLNSIVTRTIDPNNTATITLGTIKGGTGLNVVPDYVKIRGMIRCVNNTCNNQIIDKIKMVSKNIANSFGGNCEVTYKQGYPSIYSDDNLTEMLVEVITSVYSRFKDELLIGETNLLNELCNVCLCGEDFGYYSNHIPATYFFIGTGDNTPLHSSYVMLDDSILKITMLLMSSYVFKYFNKTI